MAKYCTNCGAPLLEGDRTCLSCGTSISEMETPVFDEMALTEVVDETSSSSTGTEEEMKFCAKCGQKVRKDAVVCPHCGCAVNGASPSSEQDSDSIGWGFLGFFVPIAGFILWLMWKDKAPKKAKKLGIGALISVCLGAAGSVLSFIPALF